MNRIKKISRKVISYVLALVMVFSAMTGIVPGTSMTAHAATSTYTNLKNNSTVVHFDNKDWYLIEDNSSALNAGTVTLLSKECVGLSKYNESGSFVEYKNSPTVKTAVDNWYDGNITAGANTAVSGSGMFLLTKDQANAITNADVRKCSNVHSGFWWLCSQGGQAGYAAVVDCNVGSVYVTGYKVDREFGVRPALKLDLSKVTYDSNSKTFLTHIDVSSISLNQTNATINVPNTVTLTATVAPSNASNKTVTWISSNTNIATVNNGVVTAVSPGNATITARATNGTSSTADDKTANCAVTVNPGEGSISYGTPSVDKTYGDDSFTNILTKNGDGAVTYASSNPNVATVGESSGQVTIHSVGEATITATVADSTKYTYDTKTASYTLNVAKAAPAVTAPTPKPGLSYSGEKQELVNAGGSADGEMRYAKGTDSGASEEYTTSIPKGTDADTYYVWYKVIGDSNHTDSEPAKVEVSIAQKPVPELHTNQKPTVKNDLIYNDGPQELVNVPATDLPEGYTIEYSLNGRDYSQDIPKGTEAGSYTVKVRYNGGKNYTTFDGDDLTAAIAKQGAPELAALSASQKPAANELTYTREAQELVTAPTVTTPEGANSTYTVTYALGDSDTYSTTIPKGTEAGTYTVKVRYEGGNNYVTFDGEPVTVTIKPCTITANDVTTQDCSYNGSTQNAVITVKHGGTVLTEDTEYTVSGALSGVDVKSYRVSITGKGNYTGTVYKIWRINRAAVTVTANNAAKTYGDEDPEFTATVKDEGGNDVDSSLLEWTYSRTEGEDVGTYMITPVGNEAQGNYTVTYAPGELTISQRPATVKADNKEKLYGLEDPELTATVTGLVGDDTIAYTLNRAEGETVGDYTITPTGEADQGNYTVTFETGTLKIKKRPLSTDYIRLDHITFNYDNQSHAPQPVFEGYENVAENTDYSLSGTKSETAKGVYTLTVTAKGDSFTGSLDLPWYIMGVGDQTCVYDGQEHSLTVDAADGIVFPDGNPAYTQAGKYSVAYQAEMDNPWHEADPENEPEKLTITSTAILTIEKRPVTVAAKNQSVVVNNDIAQGTEQVTVSAVEGDADSGLVSGHILKNITLTADSTAAVTTGGTITPAAAKVEDAAGRDVTENYAITYTNGVLTVTKAVPVVTLPEAVSGLEYTDEDQVLITAGSTTGGQLQYAVTDSDAVLTDGDWSTEVPKKKLTGSYKVYYRVVGNENYESIEPTVIASVTITTPDKTALNEAITEATTLYDGINTSYTEIAGTLNTAINAAKSVADNPNVTAGQIASSTQDLNNAIQAARNAIAQAEAQALTTAKTAAKTELDTKYNAINKDNYDADGKNALEEAYNAAVSAIEAATVPDTKEDNKDNGPWKAEKAGEEALDAVKTKEQKATEAFSEIQTLINNSTESPVVFTLTGPIKGDLTIPDGKEVILDLNGYEVDGNLNAPSGSKLTIKDSSEPMTGTVKGTVTANTGEVIIQGGRYDNNPTATDPGTVVITGGIFEIAPTVADPYAIKEGDGEHYKYQVLPRATVGQVPVTKADLISDGNDQVLITAGETGHGTMYYAVGENGDTAPQFDGDSTGNDRKWKTSLPTGKEAGTYHIWYMVKGDDDHSDSVPACITVNIALGEPGVREVLANAIDYETGKFKKSDKYEINVFYVGVTPPKETDPPITIPDGGYDLLNNVVDLNNDDNPVNNVNLYVRAKNGSDTSAWVNIPLPTRQSTDGIAADYNRDTLTGVYEGVKYSTDDNDPTTGWTASDSSDLTKAPVSWDGTSTKTLKFIVPGDQDKQLFPSKVKTITLGTKGTAPTEADLNGYPVEGDNIKPRSANLPTPKTDGVTLQYRYRKNPDGTWTSWGSSNKAIGLEMGTKYDYEVRFAPGKDEHGNPTPASKAFPVSPDTASFTTKMIKPDADEFLNKHVDYSATPSKYTGDDNVFEYSTNENGDPATAFSNNDSIPDAPSGFYIRYKDTDKDTEGDSPSEWVFIPTRNIPSDVGEVDKTDEPITGAGGTLTGTDETMEYRYRKTGTDEWSDWMPCTSGMTGMSAGDYQIRKKGTDSGLPSFAKHLTIAGSTETATIAVIVEDSDHTPVTGAKVQATLVGGATVPGSADTENDGKYNIIGLSAGTYLIVVTGSDGHQVTTLVDVKEVNHTVTLILPTGRENSSKLVDNTGNNIAVGGIDDQAAALDQSEPQKEYLITFKAEEKSEDASDETTRTAIKGIKDRVESESTYKDLEGNSVDVQKEFVDFTVEKKLLSNAGGTGGEVGDTEKISETSRVMEIVYPYPQITIRFGIMVWRYHDGVQKFTRLSTRPTDAGSMRDATYYIDRLDKRLYIYGQKFSTYSITYTESSEIADPEPYAKAETPDFTVQDNSDKEAGTVIITCDPSNAGKEIEAGYVTADGFWHPLPGPYIISADGTAKITGLPAGNIRIRIRAAESEYYKVGDWKEYTVKVSIGDPTKDFKEQVYVVHYILEYNGKQMTKTSEPVSYTAVNTHEDNDGNKYYGISANKEFFDAAAEKLLKKADNPTDRIISYSIVCKSVYADGSPVLKEGTAYAVEDKRISIEAGKFIDENGIAYNDIPYQYNDIYVYANVGAYATDKDTDGVVITSPVGVKYSGLPHKLSCDPGALKQGAGRSASYDLEISIYDTKTKKADGENYELKYGRDYTVSYRNNKNASVRVSGTPGNAYYRQIYDEADAASKWPKIMIVGKGNYSGMKSVLYFDILPASVNESYGAAGNFADAVKTSYVLGRKGGISLTPAPARYARNYDKYADTYVTNKLKTVRYSLGKDAAVELQKWDSASASWKRLGDLTNASMRRQVTASVVNPGAYRVKVTGLNDYCGEAYDEFSVYAYQSVMFSSLKLKTASVKYAAEGIGAEKLVTGIRTKVKNAAGKNVTIPASELSVTLLPVSESASVSTDGAKALSAGKYKAYVRPKDAADFAKKYPKVAIDSEATADVTVKGNRLNKKMFTLNLSTKGEACNGSAKDIGITLNGIKAEDVTLAKTVVKNGRTVNIPLTDSELKGALKVDSDTKITVRGRYTLNDGRTVDNSLPGTYRIILYGKKGYADTTCIISYKRISAALTAGKLSASPASFNVSGAMTTIRVTLPDGKSVEEISGTGNDLFKVTYKNNKATGDATATVTVRSDKTGYKKGSKAAVTFKVEPKKVSAVRSYNEYTDKLAGELFIKTAGTVRAGKKAPAIRLYQASADGKKLTEVNKKYYSGEYAANVSAANTYDLKLKGKGNGLELDRTVKEAYTTYAKEAGNWTGIKLGRDAYLIKDKADGRIYTSDDIKNVSTTTAVKDMGRGRYNVAYAGGCYVLPVIEQLTVDGHVLKLADGDYTISYKNNHKTGTAGMIVTLSAKTAREHGIGGSRKYNFKIVNQTDSGLTL